MSELYFKVGADYSELQRLRQEVSLLENKIRNFKPGQAGLSLSQLQNQLADTSGRMRALAYSAAQAGANIHQSIKKGVDGAIGAIYNLRNNLSDPITATLSIAGIGALGGLLSQITKVRSNFQEMQTSINVLLGSDARGERLMGQLTDFAKVSPLDFQGVVGAAKQMLGFNIEAQKVPGFLKAIGDISMADKGRFNSLVLAFSQMSAAGKLMGQDLMQMVNAGFQPLQVIAEKTGKTIGQLKDEMSQGKISAEMVQQAFIDASSEGGKYYQMSEKASQTISGQLSMLEDAFDLMYNDLGQKAEGTIIKVIEGATMLVENYQKFLPTLGAIIATFGVYKASAMASAYAEKVAIEDKNDAIKKGFDEELKKIEEVRESRRRMQSEQLASEAVTPTFVKGARYDSEKSKDIIDQLTGGQIGNSSSLMADKDKQIAEEKTKLQASLSNIDKQIRDNNQKLKQDLQKLNKDVKEEKNQLVKELSEIDKEITEKKARLEGNIGRQVKINEKIRTTESSGNAPYNWAVEKENYTKELEQLKKERDNILSEMKPLQAKRQTASDRLAQHEIDSTADRDNLVANNTIANDKLRDQKLQLKQASADVTAQLQQEKKEMSELLALDKALASSEGSKTYMEAQLEYMQSMYDQMSPEQQMEEFGQQLHEQIEGLKAELSGLANLDSDIAEALSLGVFDEAEAQNRQQARNELDDYIASLEEQKEKILELADASQDAEEQESLSLQANTIQKQINEAQTARDAIVTDREANARLRSTTMTNADTGAKSRNSLATAALTVKTKAAAIGHHLLASAQQSATRAAQALKAAWMTNPFGLILTAISAVVSAFMAFKKTTDDIAEEANQNIKATLETRNNVEGLYATLAVADKNSLTYKNALQDLTKIAKDYGINIKDESKAYDELIAKKERLIKLIIEEGRQRSLQANIDEYVNNIKKAQDNLIGEFEKSLDGPHSKVLATLIVEDAQQNAERLMEIADELSKLGTQKIDGVENMSVQERQKALQQRQDRIKALIEERKHLLSDRASNAAKELGIDFDDSTILKATGSIMNFTKEVNENTKGLKAYTNQINDSKDSTKGLADVVEEKPLKDLDITELGKKAKECAKEMDELKSKASKKVKVDTSEAEKAVAMLEKASKETDKTQGKVEDLAATTDTAQKKADNLSSTTIAPKTDNTALTYTTDITEILGQNLSEAEREHSVPMDDTEVKDAQSDTDTLKEKLQEVDDSTARPKVDTTDIMNAISQLQLMQTVITQINGQKSNGFNTAEEVARLKELEKLMKRNEKGQLVGSQAQVDEYKAILERGKARTSMFGVELSQEKAQILSYFRDWKKVTKNGKLDEEATRAGLKAFQILRKDGTVAIDKSKMTAYERKLYEQTLAMAEREASAKADKETVKSWGDIQREYQSRITKAKTTNDLDPIKKDLNNMLGELEIDGAQYKWVKKKLEEINKRTSSKKSSDDPKQREYDLNRTKLEEDEKNRRKLEDNQIKEEELRIAQITNSSEKELETIRLTAKKRRIELDRKREDEIKRLKDLDRKQWIKQFPSEAKKKEYMWQQTKSDEDYRRDAEKYMGYQNSIEEIAFQEKESLDKLAREQLEKELEYNKDFLMKFGSYQQQKLAIAEQYADKIKKAQMAGDEIEVKRLEMQRDSEMSSVSASELDSKIDWNTNFAVIGNVMKETARQVLDNLEQYMKTSEFKALSASDKKVYMDRVEQLRQQTAGASNPFLTSTWDNISHFTKKYQESVTRFNEANKRHEQASDNLREAMRQLENATTDEEKAMAQKNVEVQRGYVKKTATDVKEAQTQKDDAESNLNTASNEAANGLAQFNEILNGITSGSLYSFANALTKMITSITSSDGVGKALGEIGGKIGGIIGAALTVIDTVGDKPAEFTESTLNKIVVSIEESLAQLPQIMLSVFKGIGGIITAPFSGLAKMFGFNGESDKNLQKDIEKLTSVNAELTRAISNLADKMDDSAIKDLPGVYEQQKQYLEDSMNNTKEMMQRSASAWSNGFLGIGGHKSSNNKINKGMDSSDWSRISDILKFSVKSASDFFNLSSEDMAKVADMAPELYEKIKNLADDGYKDAAQYMDAYIEYYKQIEELEEACHQKLTSISFDDVKNEFSSMLLDMSSDTADFAKNFESMMQKAIINSLMKEKYEERLKKWYEGFASDLGNDGNLSAQEQARRRAEYEAIVKDALSERDNLIKTMGWDSQYSQSSGANAYASMSQDTAEELNGRMTAIAVTTEAIREQNVLENITLSAMRDGFLEMMVGNNSVLEQVTSVATTLAKTSLDIAEIRDNTFVIIKPIKQMCDNVKDIKDNMKNL